MTTKRLLLALFAVDAAGAAVAVKHRVAGEPLGIGGSLDVRNPVVVALWGTALLPPSPFSVSLSPSIDIVLRRFG